jgi:pimeloyl-ACP methyl ester carboxylesterase
VSSIVTDQGIVHYETYGSGRPLVLLHGWPCSWALWHSTIEALGREFRVYALDFWGFGESGDKRESFTVNDSVALVNQFMNRLGIVQTLLIGHSMGGTVSLGVALDYPNIVCKVAVVGSPIDGSSLNVLLKLAGYSFTGALLRSRVGLPVLRTGLRLYASLMSKGAIGVQEMLVRKINHTTARPFFESIGTLRETDLRPRLAEIEVPILGIYGKKDVIVNPNQHKVLAAGVPHAQVEFRPAAGHFAMLDEPEFFVQTVRGFLLSGDGAGG